MVFRNLIFQPEVVEQRFRAVVLSHHDQQASDDQNQTKHGQMLSSSMLLLNLILLIDVTFSTPTPGFDSCLCPSIWPYSPLPSIPIRQERGTDAAKSSVGRHGDGGQ